MTLLDLQSYFSYYKTVHCLYIKSTAFNVRSQLQRPEGLLYDAERDLLAIAKFFC